MNGALIYAAAAAGAYVIGSFPTAYLAGRFLKGVDIRRHGSGNVGATNVFRVVGRRAGIATLLIDACKGALCVALAAETAKKFSVPYPDALPLAAGLFAILGHTYTIFLGFKGGKGVATSAGMVAGLSPTVFFIAIAVFAMVFYFKRYVSLGSICAAVSIFPSVFFVDIPLPHKIVFMIVGLIVIIKHKKNIERLIKGVEPRLDLRKKAADRKE